LPDWPYNLFAMVHAPTRDQALQLVESIAKLLGEHDRGHTVLFSSRILKKTGLRFQP
ncbi:MAG: Lrp/AsnC family transcriptional regulator, partial [Halobacteria archaeon]|nr:Lrp/AsnC family transcriptional regulator [Halobacteria archaeon]